VEVLGDVAMPRQTDQEREQRLVEHRINLVERVRLALAKPSDQRQLGLPVHNRF
jgi:hypothetical protein